MSRVLVMSGYHTFSGLDVYILVGKELRISLISRTVLLLPVVTTHDLQSFLLSNFAHRTLPILESNFEDLRLGRLDDLWLESSDQELGAR